MIIKLMGAILKECEDRAKQLLASIEYKHPINQEFPYFRYLMVMRNHPCINQNELAKLVDVNKGSASKAVKFMLNSNLIYRETDKKDSRVKHLHLTELGEEISDKFKNVLSEVQEKLLSGFSSQEVSLLNKMLNEAYNNIVNETNRGMLKSLDSV